MTEEKTIKTDAKKSEKKRQTFLTKLVIFFSLIIFAYFGFKYLQISYHKEGAKSDVAKYDNVESEIFDLSDEAKSEHNQDDLTDITVNEIKERGSEFVYQMLLKNQLQIDGLRTDVAQLKGEILKYKSQEKIGKMILIYVDVRQKIFAGENFSNELKNFEILSSSDRALQTKVDKLKQLLPSYPGNQKLISEFKEIIPDLIVTNEKSDAAGMMAKIRRNISKLVVVRRIDERSDSDIDAVVVKIEKSLQKKDYQAASDAALSLDPLYAEILKNFLNDLSAALEVQKTDQEILNYLKSLT